MSEKFFELQETFNQALENYKKKILKSQNSYTIKF